MCSQTTLPSLQYRINHSGSHRHGRRLRWWGWHSTELGTIHFVLVPLHQGGHGCGHGGVGHDVVGPAGHAGGRDDAHGGHGGDRYHGDGGALGLRGRADGGRGCDHDRGGGGALDGVQDGTA